MQRRAVAARRFVEPPLARDSESWVERWSAQEASDAQSWGERRSWQAGGGVHDGLATAAGEGQPSFRGWRLRRRRAAPASRLYTGAVAVVQPRAKPKAMPALVPTAAAAMQRRARERDPKTMSTLVTTAEAAR